MKLLIKVLVGITVCSSIVWSTSLDNDLIAALNGGSVETAKLLIEKGADVNAKDLWGVPLLQNALSQRHEDIAKLLIEKGADVNAKNKNNGDTPLLLSTSRERFNIAKLLIEKGADVNVRDQWGVTPLMYASLSNSIDTARLLIEKGADVNAKNNDYTPLRRAVENNSIDTARLLIEKGADVNATPHGNSLLTIALLKDYMDLAKLLIEKGANLSGESLKILVNDAAIPNNIFSDKKITLNSTDSKIGSKVVSFSFTNKLPKFVQINSVSFYMNGEIIGQRVLETELPPEATTKTILLPIATEMFSSLATTNKKIIPIKYGFAVKYTVDDKSQTLYVIKNSQINLW